MFARFFLGTEMRGKFYDSSIRGALLKRLRSNWISSFLPPGSPGLDLFMRHMLLAHCLAVLERDKDIEKDKYKDKDKERKISLLDLCY